MTHIKIDLYNTHTGDVKEEIAEMPKGSSYEYVPTYPWVVRSVKLISEGK